MGLLKQSVLFYYSFHQIMLGMNKFQKEFWNSRMMFLLKITQTDVSLGFIVCKVQLYFRHMGDIRTGTPDRLVSSPDQGLLSESSQCELLGVIFA